MDSRQAGGTFPTYSLDTAGLVDDDFLFLDPNLTIDSDFSSFLDSAPPTKEREQEVKPTTIFTENEFGYNPGVGGSLLPADEWSGTTNGLPDTPSSHQQLQQCLEGSSTLQQGQLQAQTLQAGKPQQQPQQQQFGFETQLPAVSQPAQEAIVGNQQQQLPLVSEQMDVLTTHLANQQARSNVQPQPGLHMQVDTPATRPPVYGARQPLVNGPSNFSAQPLQSPTVNTPRDIGLQSPQFQGLHQPDAAVLPTNFVGQPQRTYDTLQGRQMISNMAGFQGAQPENPDGAFRMSFPRGLMVNGFGMPGATGAQQMNLPGQQSTLSHMQNPEADANAVNLQNQLMSNQSNFSTHGTALPPSQFMSKGTARQPILQTHTFNSHLPSFQLQGNQQMQMQRQSKLHPQVLNNQQAVINQGLLQSRQVPLGPQQSVFSPAQPPSYQLLTSQGYPMHPNAAQLAMNRQVLQPRLQNQLFQGLRLGGRPVGQPFMGGPQMTSAPAEVTRYPASGTNAAKCAQVFMLYIQEQRKRPADNNINFWRNLVQKFFAPGATKRWCLTSYSTTSVGRHAQGLFPMDYWYCNLCGIQPGRGFESGTDVLPRLFKIKYDSGVLDELLFLDVATEKYSLPSGKIVLEYSRAVHESVFAELRVVRHGKLRVTFNSSFKICMWEFCTKAHEEVVPRKNLLQQVHQLASLVIEADQENFDKSAENLKSHCNSFTKAAKQLAVQLDAPLVNDLGFSKRYVRCLQIAEVVNSMKDLISFERKLGVGPIESLTRFPTVKKLQMEGAIGGFPPSVSLTQMINELTQGPSSLQSSTVTRLQSESLSEAQEQAANQAQSSVFKGMEASGPVNPQQRGQLEGRTQPLVQPSAYNQIQAMASGPVQSHSMNQLSQLTAQPQGSQPTGSQSLGQPPMNSSQQTQQTYQQVVGKPGGAKSSLSQPSTPQSEMSDVRSNT